MSVHHQRFRNCLLITAAIGSMWGGAQAQTVAANSAPETVTITASPLRSLEQFTPTGSRLNLSTRDTPATLDIIENGTILARGYLKPASKRASWADAPI